MSIDPNPMQAAWVTFGFGSIDWAKVTRYALRRIYLDARWTTKAQIDELHNRGVEAGVYWGAGWLESTGITTPEQLAKRVSGILTTVAPGTSQCAVMFDLEHIAPLETIDFTLATLQAWRKLRPGKWTSWTFEGFQGGSFTPELVAAINADVNLVVLPQHYGGAMQPWAGDSILRNLLVQGVQLERVQGFYNGAALPGGWRGCIFTLETLP